LSEMKLELDSEYAKFDADGDGVVTDNEMVMGSKLLDIENEDKRQDAQRNMAWFALFGMLLYPALVVFCMYIELGIAANILGDMAPTYFVSVAAIVAAFYAKSAIEKKKENG
jgi:hypothetical protein